MILGKKILHFQGHPDCLFRQLHDVSLCRVCHLLHPRIHGRRTGCRGKQLYWPYSHPDVLLDQGILAMGEAQYS